MEETTSYLPAVNESSAQNMDQYTVQPKQPSLLHKLPEINVRANIASMTKKSGALLLLIFESIEGRDSLYKHRRNILLDSGPQISLIRLDSAENL